MSEMLIEVGLCARNLELDMSMSNFDKRLDVQKKFYLMQVFGVDLGFQYKWYLRGPYCTELTKAAYELLRTNIEIDEYEFSDETVQQNIQQCNEWIQTTKPIEMENLDWEELLASLHFIQHNAYMNVEKNKQSVCNELKQRKSWYSSKDIEYAWDTLNEVQLIDNKIRHAH